MKSCILILAYASLLYLIFVSTNMILFRNTWNNQLAGISMEHNAGDREVIARLKGPLAPDDPALLQLIKDKYLIPPSRQRYRLRYVESERNPYVSGIFIQSILRDFFSLKKKGFFVEAGALDGEYMSHTFPLERDQGWSGLLVEPDPENFKQLQKTGRRAWTSPSCLARRNFPEHALLQRESYPILGANHLYRGKGSISQLRQGGELRVRPYDTIFTTAQCLPVASLLAALSVAHVDFFVLDVESAERDVLSTFPFGNVTVDLWAIEHIGPWEDVEFVKFMIAKGYYLFDKLCEDVADYIFVRKESELYKVLEVPHRVQNRTGVCVVKDRYVQKRNELPDVSEYRDPHHYKPLSYKYIDA